MKENQLNFEGLICPVFTAFMDDEKRDVNLTGIDNYAQYLHQNRIQGVLVNAAIGEGTTLTTDERKRTAEEWLKACRKYQLICVVHIGGTSIADVFDLAEHAESIGVDAVLVLPDLFFRPVSEEDLVLYLQQVVQHCSSRPLLYYHIPMYSNVNPCLLRLCQLCQKDIPTFSGIHFVSPDMDEATRCLNQGYNLFLGYDAVTCGALALGFKSAILTTLNICPEIVHEIFENVRNNKLAEAMMAQEKLTSRIREICPLGGDFVRTMKNAFNNINAAHSCGPCRKPGTIIIQQ